MRKLLLPKPARLSVIVGIAALLVVAGMACADSATSRSDLLRRQLAPTLPSLIPARASALASSLPDECTQLELDLIIYRWRLHKEGRPKEGLPPDVTSLDLIISALQTALGSQIVNWTDQLFALAQNHKETSVMRPADDARVESLVDLKTMIEAAIEDKEYYPTRAVESLRNAAGLCQDLSLEICEAYVCKDLADHYQYDMGRYRLAESFYDRASRPFQSYGCAASNARVHDDWGFLYTSLGRHSDAAEHHILAAQQWGQLIRENPRAYKYLDMAGIQYIKAGEAREAAGDSAGALDLMKVRGLGQLRNYAAATGSSTTLLTNQITVATFMRERLAKPDSALTLLDEAKKRATRQDDLLLVARVYDELAKTYAALRQNYNRHAAILKRTSKLKQAAAEGEAAAARWAKIAKAPGSQVPDLLTVADRGATAFEELQQFARASDLWKKIADLCGGAQLIDDQLRCLRSLASALSSQKKPTEALQVRMEAVALAKNTSPNDAADIVMSMIQAFRDENHIQDALEGFNELETIVISTGNSRQLAEMLESRGAFLASLGRYEEAVPDFQASSDRYVTQVGDVWAAGQVSLELARALTSTKRVENAAAALAAALDKIENSYGFESSHSTAYHDHNVVLMNLYAELAADYVRSGRDAAAIDCVRKAAQRYPWLLSDLLAELRSGSDPLVAKFAANSDLLRGMSDSTDAASAPLLLASDPAGFVRACRRLQQDYQSAYNSLAIRPFELFKSRAGIPRDTAVIEFMPTESSIYALICGRDLSVCRQLDGASVSELVGRLRKTLEDCEQSLGGGVPIAPVADWRSPSFLQIKEPLAALYSRLIAPLREDLGGQQQLVFALSKELAGLPMQALISGEQDGRPRFLIQDYRVSYLIGGMLDDLVGSGSREIYPSIDTLAIFADPEDNLPGAKLEAANIKNRYINSRMYVGKGKATAGNFLVELKQAGLLHIAAHHSIEPNPSGFELLLAPEGSSDGAIGITQLSDVINPTLQLVVLSACDTVGSIDSTSTGPAQAVEMFSLAGAKSVLGASWKVSDDAASQVFTDFYRYLNRGKSRTEALQLAQLSMVESKQFAHPFYWGCFSLYGNPR